MLAGRILQNVSGSLQSVGSASGARDRCFLLTQLGMWVGGLAIHSPGRPLNSPPPPPPNIAV